MLAWLGGLLSSGAALQYLPASFTPPLPAREFRAAWVATVNNIDWPSKPGLTVPAQKAELLALLDSAARLRLNAIVLQIRPGCDALYASRLEPWSEYLTGRMGQAPRPHYDPLEFAVAEAHRRGLELHAWLNPYRARHSAQLSPASGDHISRQHPDWVRSYGTQMWLDPGSRAVQDYALRVFLDVVRRYDLDGVHIDDYFYPYAVKGPDGKPLDFPDEPTWQVYVRGGGRLSRADWRRQNVDSLISRLYFAVKAAKPWVKVGVSPFGIWRPGYPAQIRGLDAYSALYADSRKWVANGWADYFAPQLYWNIDDPGQSYPVLLNWWAAQNVKGRHLWPGISTIRIGSGKTTGEIVSEIRLTRQQAQATGNIHWSIKALSGNRGGVADTLAQGLYAQPALVPASPWLDRSPPGAPRVSAALKASSTLHLSWKATGSEPVWLWVLQRKVGPGWSTLILPGGTTSHQFSTAPTALAVTAVDRCGNASRPTTLALHAGPRRK